MYRSKCHNLLSLFNICFFFFRSIDQHSCLELIIVDDSIAVFVTAQHNLINRFAVHGVNSIFFNRIK